MRIEVVVSTAAGQAKYDLAVDNDDNLKTSGDGALMVLTNDGKIQDWFGPGFWHHVHAEIIEDE